MIGNYINARMRLYNRPHMVLQNNLEMVHQVLEGRVLGTGVQMEAAAEALPGPSGRDFNPLAQRTHEGYRLSNGIAQIDVWDTLYARNGLTPASGATGYDGIGTQYRAAQRASSVRGIFLNIDSGGGEGTGALDLAKEIEESNEANGGKPVWAAIDGMGCSAAYAIASGADIISASETAWTASIGVITMAVDASAMLEAEGLAVTVIRAGNDKAKPHPYEAHEAGDYDRLQASVNRMWDVFVGRVAHNRGLDAESIYGLEGTALDAPEALDAGLIDGIGSQAEAFTAFQDHLR